MGGFENQVRMRAKEVKHFFKRGFRAVAHSCKNGLRKVKRIKK